MCIIWLIYIILTLCCTKPSAFDNEPVLELLKKVNTERQLNLLKDTVTKHNDQTIWYENDELIKEYLDSSKYSPKHRAVRQREKLSLIQFIKNSMADPID